MKLGLCPLLMYWCSRDGEKENVSVLNVVEKQNEKVYEIESEKLRECKRLSIRQRGIEQ